jgi:hypothetical protein
MLLKKYPTSQHRYDYSIIFFFAWLIVKNIPPNPKKVTPTIPIIDGIPISYILVVVGHSSLIRYPKISNSAEMILSSIPIINNPFFMSIFYSLLIITVIIAEKIMSSIAIINNLFFVSIFYSLSNIINILIPIRLSSCILYKMKESLFFSFFYLIRTKNHVLKPCQCF